MTDTDLVFDRVQEKSSIRDAARGSLGGLFLSGDPPAVGATVITTGRCRGVFQRRTRVFGPGYNRSCKWLVAP
jgi:hypothetical protein